MSPQHNDTLRAMAVFVIIAFISGCSSSPKTAEASEPKKAVAEQEYKNVPTLGSWIPTKVKKGSAPRETHVEDIDPEALDKVTQTGRTHQGAGGGGK